MCSLGHHDHADTVRPPRRHLDNSASSAVRKTPAKTLKQRKADKHAELRRDVEAGEAEELFQQHSAGSQLELIPPDEAQLPAHRVKDSRLPPPESLYYSSAREA